MDSMCAMPRNCLKMEIAHVDAHRLQQFGRNPSCIALKACKETKLIKKKKCNK